MKEKYYLKKLEESLEECIENYGNNFHTSLEEARDFFESNKLELGDCVLVKVTEEVVGSLIATKWMEPTYEQRDPH